MQRECRGRTRTDPDRAVVYVSDHDDGVLGALRSFLEVDGLLVEDYGRGEAFLAELARLALVAARGKRWPPAE